MTPSPPLLEPQPVNTPLGLRYRCPCCGTDHEFMTTATICLLLHAEKD